MKRIFSFVAALVFAATAFAQQMPTIPVDPAVRIGKLDNGLTYYIRHNEEPKGQANFYIAQKVGSILEEENQRGLAHFLEHMCFNGTVNFPGNGVIDYCESIGVKFGANLNAYTSIDETVYNIDNVPVAKVPSAIDSCLLILHDWADGLLLTDKDIDDERGVIHEEWRTRSNASMRMIEQLLPMAYPNNRYGQRLPIGLMEVVDNFPYKAIRDYYEKWYRPDQQGIIVVGDIDVDQIEAKIKDIFGPIQMPENPAERYYVPVENNETPIIAIAKDKEFPYAVSEIYFKHDVYPDQLKGDLNYLVYLYAKAMIESMLNARLAELAESPQPPFIQGMVQDAMFFISKTKDAFTTQCVTNENAVALGFSTVYREVLRAVRGGFTASEYERARTQYLANVESMYNQREKIKSANYCKEYVSNFINSEPIPGIENEYMLSQQLAPNIPVEVINQVFKSFIGTNNIVVTMMLPDKDGVVYPTEQELLGLMASVAAEDIAPYEDKVSDEPLISQLPAAGKVKAKEASKFGYTKYTLSNGAKLYFRKTDFNKDEIIFKAYSLGGLSMYPDSEEISLKVMGDIIDIGGLGNFSVTELRKALAGKKASLTATIGANYESITGKATPKDFETLMQLVYLNFTSIRKDTEAFESWQNKMEAVLSNAEKEPMQAFQDSVSANLFRSSARVGNIKSSQVRMVDYDHVLAMGRERFANAADFTFYLTGNIDEDVAIPMVEQYIASLPGNPKSVEKMDPTVHMLVGGRECTFDREMEVPMATILFVEGNYKPEYTFKKQVALTIGTQALSTILLEEIREKEGGTYSIAAQSQFAAYPAPYAFIQIVYQTNPDRYEYLNGRVNEIVKGFIAEGPTEEQMAKTKEYLLKNHLENQTENSYWMGVIQHYAMAGVDTDTNYEEIVKGITVDDIREVMTEVVAKGEHSEVIMKGVPMAK